MPDFSSQHLLLFAADSYPSSDQTAYGISLLDQERWDLRITRRVCCEACPGGLCNTSQTLQWNKVNLWSRCEASVACPTPHYPLWTSCGNISKTCENDQLNDPKLQTNRSTYDRVACGNWIDCYCQASQRRHVDENVSETPSPNFLRGNEPENQLAAKACYVLPWIFHHACQWLSNGQNPALKQSTAFSGAFLLGERPWTPRVPHPSLGSLSWYSCCVGFQDGGWMDSPISITSSQNVRLWKLAINFIQSFGWNSKCPGQERVVSIEIWETPYLLVSKLRVALLILLGIQKLINCGQNAWSTSSIANPVGNSEVDKLQSKCLINTCFSMEVLCCMERTEVSPMIILWKQNYLWSLWSKPCSLFIGHFFEISVRMGLWKARRPRNVELPGSLRCFFNQKTWSLYLHFSTNPFRQL